MGTMFDAWNAWAGTGNDFVRRWEAEHPACGATSSALIQAYEDAWLSTSWEQGWDNFLRILGQEPQEDPRDKGVLLSDWQELETRLKASISRECAAIEENRQSNKERDEARAERNQAISDRADAEKQAAEDREWMDKSTANARHWKAEVERLKARAIGEPISMPEALRRSREILLTAEAERLQCAGVDAAKGVTPAPNLTREDVEAIWRAGADAFCNALVPASAFRPQEYGRGLAAALREWERRRGKQFEVGQEWFDVLAREAVKIMATGPFVTVQGDPRDGIRNCAIEHLKPFPSPPETQQTSRFRVSAPPQTVETAGASREGTATNAHGDTLPEAEEKIGFWVLEFRQCVCGACVWFQSTRWAFHGKPVPDKFCRNCGEELKPC